jgi:CheY-like chemotaxis protein
MKALIIDDEPFICELLSEFLKPFGDVSFLTEGAEALDRVKEAYKDGSAFDLLCLDINLAEISGLNILKDLRVFEKEMEIPEEKAVNVVMITSSYESQYFFEAHQYGCQGYLTKPILREDLLGKVEELGIISDWDV